MKDLAKAFTILAVIIGAVWLLGNPPGVHAAAAGHGAAEAGHGHHAGPPVSADAPALFHVGPLPVTNSMIYTWIIAGIIFWVVRSGTRSMREVPSGTQNVVESAVEALEDLTKGLLEPKVARWVFPFAATFFLFIVISNLMGLLPGVGSIGRGAPAGGGLPLGVEHVDVPLFRPPTADANMTIAMSAVFFFMNLFWALRYNGPLGLVKHLFGVKGGMRGAIVIPLSLIFIFIGLIEVISMGIRPVALAMRLYGNIYGGESVLTIMLTNSPLGLGALPFYFLELLVAVVQALVFTLLAIAFTGALCSHEEEEGHEAHAH
jgi:F-type H+-transporting ATPase subunit a